jgi:transcription initiation factor TFIID subunit 13
LLALFYKLLSQIPAVKNLMYGFGDDRNPANDTVSVMEEILVEFIADVVRVSVSRYRVAEVWVSKLK